MKSVLSESKDTHNSYSLIDPWILRSNLGKQNKDGDGEEDRDDNYLCVQNQEFSEQSTPLHTNYSGGGGIVKENSDAGANNNNSNNILLCSRCLLLPAEISSSNSNDKLSYKSYSPNKHLCLTTATTTNTNTNINTPVTVATTTVANTTTTTVITNTSSMNTKTSTTATENADTLTAALINGNNITAATNGNNSTKLSVRIISHFRRFCETTSVRGVPKIVNSVRRRQRYLWLLFVTAFFIGCFTSVILLINQYLSYDVLHQPKTDYHGAVDFPSATFCNSRPFSERTKETLKQYNIASFDDILLTTRRLIRNKYFRKKSFLKKEDTINILHGLTMSSYLLSLPRNFNIDSMGHKLNVMIIKCIVSIQLGPDLLGEHCNKTGTWVLTKHELFLNCYTFTIHKNNIQKAKGIELVIYLDASRDLDCMDCSIFQVPSSQSTGIRFAIHASNTYPDVMKEGFTLSPGTLTDAIFFTKHWIMLEPPFGKCSKQSVTSYYLMEGNFTYSLYACEKYKLQRKLSDSCGCIRFYDVPYDLKHLYQEKRICNFLPLAIFSNQSYDINKETLQRVLKQSKCETEVMKSLTDIYNICADPCTYHTFEPKISSGLYPTKSYHLRFSKNIKEHLR